MIVYLDNSFLNRPFDDPEVGVNKQKIFKGKSVASLYKEAKKFNRK